MFETSINRIELSCWQAESAAADDMLSTDCSFVILWCKIGSVWWGSVGERARGAKKCVTCVGKVGWTVIFAIKVVA